MDAEFVTERLALRRFTPGDAANLLALDSDPAVMRFLDRRTTSLSQVEAEVLPRFLDFHRAHPGFGWWVAGLRHDGTFIGWFGLRAVTPADGPMVDWPDATGPPAAELGYRLRRDAWGHGYATEGARALVRRAFTGLGVTEVVATTMAVNTRSRAVLAKAGLTHVRTVHLAWEEPLAGSEHGDVEYRLHRDDRAGG
ncbi:MAG TPA: GNAT family N-acetyltransferase [Streptosporangiaceae bacterium]